LLFVSIFTLLNHTLLTNQLSTFRNRLDKVIVTRLLFDSAYWLSDRVQFFVVSVICCRCWNLNLC